MKIKKQIIKIGTSQGIIIDNLIMKNLGLKIGDWLDISDIIKVLPYEKSSKKMLKSIKDEVDPIGTRSRNGFK